MAKTIKNNWLIFVLLSLSFFLRFYNISSVPYALDGDEAAFGYYGYSLFKNFSDEYGNKLPLYFPSIGDYKYPLYAYLSLVPVYIFGLSEFSARFTSAFLGSLFPLLMFFAAKKVFENKKVAYLTMFISTISPMSIMFSRGAYESNLGLFLSTLGIMFVLNGSFFSIIPYLLSFFSYSANRVYVLVFLFLFSFLAKSKKTFLVFILLAIFVAFSFLDKKSLVRAYDIGFKQNGYLLSNTEKGIWEDGIVFNGKYIFITRLFNNKPLVFVKSFGERYFQHLSPTYLFFTSNPNMPKYSVPEMGLFYYFEIITILAGFYGLSKIKNTNKFVPIIIILASIVPSALTIETPNPIRTLSGLSGWLMLSAYGAYVILEKLRNWKIYLYIPLFLIAFTHLFYFLHQYFVSDTVREPWYTDGGIKEVVLTVNELQAGYDKVVISGDPYIFFLFYNKVEPDDFVNTSKIKTLDESNWNRVESFGKLIFNMPFDCPKVGRLNVLYVCRKGDIPINSKLLKTIRFNDGNVAFNIIEFVPISKHTKETLPENVHYMVESDSYYKEGILPADSSRFW